MIKWLTGYIGTASYMEGYPYCEKQGINCLDVRDLVDKRGNTFDSIKQKIDQGIQLLREGKKIIVCCDYGMSRSNSLAAGIISKYENRAFSDVVEEILAIVGEGAIKIEVLNLVRASIEQDEGLAKESIILVTGSSGFIGRSFITKLNQQGYKVVTPLSNEINLEEDVVRLELLVKKTRPSHIVHLANPRVYTHNAAMGKTLAMLKNVLDVCSTNGIKLLYPSGWEVYSGYASEGLFATETLPLLAKGTYGETKLLCEQLIHNYRMFYNLSCTIVRFSPLYGSESDRPKFIYNFIDKALKNQPITTHIYQNGSPHLDLLSVDDAVEALYQIIKCNLLGEYNVGTGKGYSTLGVAKLVIEAANSSSIILHNHIDDYASNILMETTKIKRFTDWKVGVNFEDWVIQRIKDIKQVVRS